MMCRRCREVQAADGLDGLCLDCADALTCPRDQMITVPTEVLESTEKWLEWCKSLSNGQ